MREEQFVFRISFDIAFLGPFYFFRLYYECFELIANA